MLCLYCFLSHCLDPSITDPVASIKVPDTSGRAFDIVLNMNQMSSLLQRVWRPFLKKIMIKKNIFNLFKFGYVWFTNEMPVEVSCIFPMIECPMNWHLWQFQHHRDSPYWSDWYSVEMICLLSEAKYNCESFLTVRHSSSSNLEFDVDHCCVCLLCFILYSFVITSKLLFVLRY